MTDELSPPRKSVELQDPGARELESSESDEHFSDASEGREGREARAGRAEGSNATSPIPTTRVERVDDEPAYGEIPGTDAYQKRTQDAVPDEVEVVPDGTRSRSASRVSLGDRPITPGGSPIPKTVVEKVDPDSPSYGDVPGTHAHTIRAADAVPDIVLKAPQPPERKSEGSPTASMDRSSLNDDHDVDDDDGAEKSDSSPAKSHELGNGEEDGEFGDDFDDFEEGGEGDDFGDFDDGFQGEEQAETTFDKTPNQPSVPAPSPGPPVLEFEDLTSLEEVVDATKSYIEEIYPSLAEVPTISTTPHEAVRSIFLSERSLSLWSQLVAPPGLQPPDWVRSRIRRLFLVSLGVPVDLDEILPASKQKKLVLPSIHIPGEKSPRPSADERNGALGRVKRENASSGSIDSSASKSERKRKGPLPPPQLDISSTTMLCSTTDAALSNFTDDELRAHIKRLEELKERANEVFEYWQKRMESALGDKEAFESVIENLVAHAKKLR